MSESVTIDNKGRVLLPKKLRKAAGLALPGQAVATVVGEGRIELVAVDPEMKRARQIARMKLAGWREEEHEAEKLALHLAKKENP